MQISIAIALFSMIVIVFTLRSVGRDRIGIRSGLIWVGLWLAIAVVALFPELLDAALAASGMQNRVLFALIAAVLVLFATLFAQSTRMQSMERDIARLTRHLALVRFTQDLAVKGDSETQGMRVISSSPHEQSGNVPPLSG